MTIFEELVALTTFPQQKPGEPDNDYLKALILVVYKLPDKEFWKLTGPAQTWFNNAAATDNTLQQIIDCPGFKEQKKEITPKPIIKAKLAGVTSGRVQALVPNVANVPKTHIKTKKNTGVMDAIRRCVILHPDWTTRKIYHYLKEHGWPNINQNTVAIDGGNIRRIIELSREMGFWLDANYQRIKELTEGIADEAKAQPITGTISN